uniref:FLZ-type domain-containing protein n=1 Tax=Kalanchoe fedtschenkoi TaxID=63787 RepID=A0A7N0U8K9_KALFE
MLRKRNRSVHQDQPKAYPHMSVSDFVLRNDFRNQRARKNSVFNVPGSFVGLSPKGLFECDAAKSPTSPLDYRVFSRRFRGQKCWDCNKVGLSIIDDSGGNGESRAKNIIFGPQLRIKPSTSGNNFDACGVSKSLPKNYPVFNQSKAKSSDKKAGCSRCIFEIGDEAGDAMEPELVEVFRSCSLDSSGRRFPPVRKSNLGSNLRDRKFCSGSIASNCFPFAPIKEGLKRVDVAHFRSDTGHGAHEFISAADVELSEDYTSVTSHGPNPKTTRIYSDGTLERHSIFPNASTSGLTINMGQRNSALYPVTKCASVTDSLPSKNFLSACNNCGKRLDGGDIFMYRGEKAFCSLECRESEIVNSEDSDERGSDSSGNSPGNAGPEPPMNGHSVQA